MINEISDNNTALYEAERLVRHLSKRDIPEVFDELLFVDFAENIIVYSPTELGFKLKCSLILKETVETC